MLGRTRNGARVGRGCAVSREGAHAIAARLLASMRDKARDDVHDVFVVRGRPFVARPCASAILSLLMLIRSSMRRANQAPTARRVIACPTGYSGLNLPPVVEVNGGNFVSRQGSGRGRGGPWTAPSVPRHDSEGGRSVSLRSSRAGGDG